MAHPSDEYFKLLGKVLFYVLIVPALCYYIYQLTSVLFTWLGWIETPTEQNQEIKKPQENNDKHEGEKVCAAYIHNQDSNAQIKFKVKIKEDRIIDITAKPTDTIAHLKIIIEMSCKIFDADQEIVLNNQILEDYSTIEDCGITSNTVLNLRVSQTSKHEESFFPVFVKDLSGNEATIPVTPQETIEKFKEKYLCIKGVPIDNQRWMFSGKQLEEGRSFEDYQIKKESTLHMINKLD